MPLGSSWRCTLAVVAGRCNHILGTAAVYRWHDVFQRSWCHTELCALFIGPTSAAGILGSLAKAVVHRLIEAAITIVKSSCAFPRLNNRAGGGGATRILKSVGLAL